jgi:hypothetical protein
MHLFFGRKKEDAHAPAAAAQPAVAKVRSYRSTARPAAFAALRAAAHRDRHLTCMSNLQVDLAAQVAKMQAHIDTLEKA